MRTHLPATSGILQEEEIHRKLSFGELMGAQALLCTSCGAALQPRVLETKVKCAYCETVFTIVRDHDGITGIAPDGAPLPGPPGTQPGASAPALSPQEQAALERLEREAALAVRGLEAVAETAYVAQRAGCFRVVLIATLLAAFVIARM